MPKGKSGTAAAVALVTSVWMTVRKPKLATQPIPLEHAVAIRIVVLSEDNILGSPRWLCDTKSEVWVVRPESLIAVLDYLAFEEDTEGCSVTLQPQSRELIQGMHDIPTWWPKLEEERGKTERHTRTKPFLASLFLRGSGGRKKGNGRKKTAVKKTVFEKGEKKKAKKKRIRKPKQVAMEIANFRKDWRGQSLIIQLMQKLKDLDDKKFSQQPLFASDGLRRLSKVEGCKDIPWDSFKQGAFGFFKAEYLGSMEALSLYIINIH